MAITTIGGADLTKLRSNQYLDDIALHVTPLVTIQTGTITAIPSLSPFVDITWDGSTTGIELEQAVKIVNGATLKAWAVIRKLPSGSTLFISTTPLGSAGSATRIENPIEIGDTVTVYSHRPLWGLYSRIEEADFFKQWDLAYTDQNENPPPVANAGTWQTAKLASGETTALFTLPRFGVDTSFAFAGATISSYLWALPSGVTLVSGFALTDNIIDVDAVAGTHLIDFTVTDSNANTHTAHLWLFVSDGATGTSLSERFVIDEMSGNSTRQGTEITFRITGDDLQDVLFVGAGLVLKQTAKFNDSDLSDGVFIDTFVGYIHPDGLEFSNDGDINSAVVRLSSPSIIADSIVQPTQELTEVSSPSNWAECTASLSNPQFFLFYSIRWHTPAMLSMHDFDAPFATPRIQFETYNTQSLGEAMKVPAINIAGNIGSTADGKTIMREHPLYMSNTDRNALPTVITWQAQDIDPDRGFNYVRRLGSVFAKSLTGAFAFDGTKKAWLAGKLWGQGLGQAQLPNFWVTVAQGITRIKEVAGHFLAEKNADVSNIPLNLNGLQDVIDPSLMIWCALNISSELDPWGLGFTNTRMLPKSVNRTWTIDSSGEVLLELTLEVQPETFGQPGEEIPIANQNTFTTDGWTSSIPVPFTPDSNNALGGLGTVIVNDDNGRLALSPDYLAVSPVYSDLSSFVNNETVCDFTLDWNSPYFSGNNPSLALRLYVVTINGTSLKVYRFNDILNTTIATLLNTYTMNDSTNTSEGRIECSQTTPTYVAVGWHDRTGTEFGYSSDSGDTWQAKTNVGNTVSDSANDNAPLGMAIDGNTTLISAPDSTPEYGIYKSTSVGGAFSAVTNTERSATVQPLIKIVPQGTKGYVTTVGTSGGDTVTFDPGGLAFTIPSDVENQGAVGGGGNPGNALVGTSVANGDWIAAKVDFVTPATGIGDISFDYWRDTANSNIQVYIDGSLAFDSTGGPTDSTWRNQLLGGPHGTLTTVEFRIKQISFGPATEMRLDNLFIENAPVGTSTQLFSVDPITGSAVWTDITPATGEAPERPHDLALDLIDNQVVDTVSGDSNNWYTSGDGGSNWGLSEASSNKRTFQTASDTLIVGGNNEVKLSLDAAATFDTKTGNLSTVWGSIGVIKRVQAL